MGANIHTINQRVSRCATFWWILWDNIYRHWCILTEPWRRWRHHSNLWWTLSNGTLQNIASLLTRSVGIFHFIRGHSCYLWLNHTTYAVPDPEEHFASGRFEKRIKGVPCCCRRFCRSPGETPGLMHGCCKVRPKPAWTALPPAW